MTPSRDLATNAGDHDPPFLDGGDAYKALAKLDGDYVHLAWRVGGRGVCGAEQGPSLAANKSPGGGLLIGDLSYGGEGGILSKHSKKFPVLMVKPNSFLVNDQKVEKRFCQSWWII